MLAKNQILAVLGTGTMGEALIRGTLRAGRLMPEQIIGSDHSKEAAARVAKAHAIKTGTDNLAAASACTVALVAVKPQTVATVLDDEKMRTALAGKLVISIAAGVRLHRLQSFLPQSRIIRAMPNTPCLIGEGMTAIARGPNVTDADAALAFDIFNACGQCVEIEEAHMDVVTALNGSGPAFAYLILEALADGAVMMGLRRDLAFSMAAQMFQGAARMVLETKQHPAALKDQVTTPAGCTIAGLLTLEDGRIRSVVARAVEEATRVAAGLGR